MKPAEPLIACLRCGLAKMHPKLVQALRDTTDMLYQVQKEATGEALPIPWPEVDAAELLLSECEEE